MNSVEAILVVAAFCFALTSINWARTRRSSPSKACKVFEAMTLPADSPEWRIEKIALTAGMRYRVSTKRRDQLHESNWRTVLGAERLKTLAAARQAVNKEKAKYADEASQWVIVE